MLRSPFAGLYAAQYAAEKHRISSVVCLLEKCRHNRLEMAGVISHLSPSKDLEDIKRMKRHIGRARRVVDLALTSRKALQAERDLSKAIRLPRASTPGSEAAGDDGVPVDTVNIGPEDYLRARHRYGWPSDAASAAHDLS